MRLADDIAAGAALVAQSWASGTSDEPLMLMKHPSGEGITCVRGYGRDDVTGKEASMILGMSYPTFKAKYIDAGRITPNKVSGRFPMAELLKIKERRARGQFGG